MKEFVNKLVARLEGMYGVDPMYYGPEAKWAVNKAIEITNEVAEEYINTSTNTSSDYCEWKWGPDYAQVQCMGDKILFGSRRMFTYCPYCGKEIKVD